MKKLISTIVHFIDREDRTTNISEVKTVIFHFATQEIYEYVNQNLTEDAEEFTNEKIEETSKNPPIRNNARNRKWAPFNSILDNNGKQCVGGGPKKCYHCRNDNYTILAHFSKIYQSAKSRAKEKGIPFTLNEKDVEELYKIQGGRCILSGVVLTFNTPPKKGDNKTYKSYRRHNASLDQIIPGAGYTIENAQLITVDANLAKNMMLDEGFIDLCKTVAEYQQKRKHSSSRKKISKYTISN